MFAIEIRASEDRSRAFKIGLHLILKEKVRSAAAFGLVATLVGVAYGNALKNPFAYDDVPIIVKNRLVAQVSNLPLLFVSDYWAGLRDSKETVPFKSGLYRPLVLATYLLNHALGGLNPVGYHLVNIIFHLFVSWLVYLIAVALGCSRAGAVIAAAIFAVHPVHTEAVTGVVGRAELLMALGLLASLWWSIQGAKKLSVAAFLVALFSKEQAVILPALLFLYDAGDGKPLEGLWRTQNWGSLFKAGVSRYGWHIVALAGYLAVRLLVLRGFAAPATGFVENPLAYVDGYSRFLTGMKVAGKYLWLFLWPASLSVDYSYNSIASANSVLQPGVLFALVGWGSLLALAVWSYRRDHRFVFCIALTVLSFLPVSNFFVAIGTIMGERLFYLPSAGLCLLAALGWDSFSGWAARGVRNTGRGLTAAVRAGGLVLTAIVCLAFTVRTHLRNQDWSSDEALINSALKIVPDNAKLYAHMGQLAMDKRDLPRAYEAYQTALRIYPDLSRRDVFFDNNYGILLLDMGRVDDAVQTLEQSTRLDSTWSLTQYNLGLAYARQGRYKEAEAAFRRALSLNPNSAATYNSLSRLMIELGRFEEAVGAADEALKREPGLLWAHFNRGWALEKLGWLDEAAREYERVLALDPTLMEVRERLRNVLQLAKRG